MTTTQKIAYLVSRYGIGANIAYEVLYAAHQDVEIAKLICNIAKDENMPVMDFVNVLRGRE